MTEQELQTIVNEVLSAIRTNSRTIGQLTSVTSLADGDYFEVAGGKKVAYSVLRDLIAAAANIDSESIETDIAKLVVQNVSFEVTGSTATLTIKQAGYAAKTVNVPVATDEQSGIITAAQKVKLDNAHTTANAAYTAATAAQQGVTTLNNKLGANSGIATLDSEGKLNSSQLPDIDDVPTAGSENVVKSGGAFLSKYDVGTNDFHWTNETISTNGNVTPSDTTKLSPYINIRHCQLWITLLRKIKYFIAFFDANKELISLDFTGIYTDINLTEVAPQNAVYIRIIIRKSDNEGSINLYVHNKNNWIEKKIELSNHRKFKLFSIPLEDYDFTNNNIDNTIKELYYSGTKIPDLKVLAVKKTGVEGETGTSSIVIGTATSSSDLQIYLRIDESEDVGTKEYSQTVGDGVFYVVIDWDTINYRYYQLYDSRYILNDNIYSKYYSRFDIDNKIQEINNVLPHNKIYPVEYKTVEQGTFSTRGGYNNSTRLFRLRLPIQVTEDMRSISADTGYVIALWGNDEGLGHDITQISNFKSQQLLIDFPYSYLFLVGKREDGADLSAEDDLTSIVSFSYERNGDTLLPVASKTEFDIIANKINKINNFIIVDAGGKGDYTSLQDALDNANDSAVSPKVILVMPGTYTMPDCYEIDGDYYSKGCRRNLSIIGTNKNSCIIRNDTGFYKPNVGDCAPIQIGGNVYIANLTIISTDTNYPSDKEEEYPDRHMAYCIHLDRSITAGNICEINNCVLINNHGACIGAGLKPNYTIKIINCELISTTHERTLSSSFYGTIMNHEGSGGSTTEINQHLIVKGCTITNTNGSYGFNAKNAYGFLEDLTFINNVIDVPDGEPGYMVSSNLITKTKKCFGNNISAMNYTV